LHQAVQLHKQRQIYLTSKPFWHGAMTDEVLQANKFLVRAHYDAVANSHDPAAIRAQIAPDFYDHGQR
jgi:hypothetical protein